MKILGQVLLWAGFLAASFFTVSSLQIDSAPWSTINWLGYGGSAMVGVVGILMIRTSGNESENEEKNAAEFSEVTTAISELNLQIGAMLKLFPEQNPPRIVEFIDNKLVPLFNQFADARDSVTAKFGLNAFGEVMTFFASGERFTNRCWSASADGYLEEAENCAIKAAGYLKQCQQKISELESR